MVRAVVFDMDGVIIDSEPVWQEVRVAFVGEYGEEWSQADGEACRGRESEVWSAMISDRIGNALGADEVFTEILSRMVDSYDRELPLFPGAVETIERVAGEYRVAVASGSPNVLIDVVLRRSGLDRVCSAVGYGDEVPRGKPAPDVYLNVLEQLDVPPRDAVGVEDSEAGLRAVLAAGMQAIAILSPDYVLPDEMLARTAVRLASLPELTLSTLEQLGVDT